MSLPQQPFTGIPGRLLRFAMALVALPPEGGLIGREAPRRERSGLGSDTGGGSEAACGER